MKLAVASKNPVKLAAAQNGFAKMFPLETFDVVGLSVPSLVRDQPLSDEETYIGARNRAEAASRELPDADYWVGIEGGVELTHSEMEAFAWVVIKSRDGRYGKGRTGTFFLPKQVSDLIQQGKELGEADDIVFGRSNSKQQNGAVGILTGDVVDRTRYYIEAVIFACIPFKNKDLY